MADPEHFYRNPDPVSRFSDQVSRSGYVWSEKYVSLVNNTHIHTLRLYSSSVANPDHLYMNPDPVSRFLDQVSGSGYVWREKYVSLVNSTHLYFTTIQ